MQTYNKDSRKLEVFIADVPQTASENSPLPLGSSTFLQDNVFSFVPSYDKASLYYLVPNAKGSVLYRYSKEKGVLLLESLPLKELTLSVTNKDVFAVSKASAFVPGQIFKLQPFTIVYGGKTGFSLNLPSSGPLSFVSMWSNNGLFSYIHDFSSGKDSVLREAFLSEKCSWSPTSLYLFCAGDMEADIGEEGLPEVWYAGDVSFTDTLYVIKNAEGSFSNNNILNISDEGKEPIDLIKPSFDGDGSYFSFINKKDGNLWVLDVTRVSP
jgi:hypothetical protein